MAASLKSTKSPSPKKKKTSIASPPRAGLTAVQKRQILGVIWSVLGILLFIFMVSDASGMVGGSISSLLRGLFGSAAYIFPLFPLYTGFLLFSNRKRSVVHIKEWASFFTVVIISCFFHLVGSSLIDTSSFANTLSDLYQSGLVQTSGGVVGGLVTMFITYLVGKTAANIILWAAIVILFIIQTPFTPTAVFSYFVEKGRQSLPTTDEDAKIEPQPPFTAPFSEPLKTAAAKGSAFRVDIPLDPSSEATSAVESATPEGECTQDKPSFPIHIAKMPLGEESKETISSSESPKNLEPLKIDTTTGTQIPLYTYPPLTLLKKDTATGSSDISGELRDNAVKLVEVLRSFGVDTKVTNVSRGPAVTRYELQPSVGVKVSRIVNLADDIALNLACSGVRIEAPIPGKAAVGIEVSNDTTSSVFLRQILEATAFKLSSSKLSTALGLDISGTPIIADLSKMPHLLIAGATGSGKSVCINSLLVSLLYKATPQEVRLLMIDPKVVELGVYNGIPHLLIPVVTDPKKAAGALNWAVSEMLNRYKLFAEANVRDCKGYNQHIINEPDGEPLPEIVIIIDELADLMMAAPNDVEDAIMRLAQMARAAGMHLVIATQRPSVDVITGVIKANIPSRISFAVSSQIDSRTILDMAGAEKLLGKGDMLYYPTGRPKPIRVQGCFITDKEVEAVVNFIKKSQVAAYNENIMEHIERVADAPSHDSSEESGDQMLPAAIEVVVEAGQASVSLLQRRLKLGYARAARIVDEMEARGIVGTYEGSKPRQVLISREQYLEMKLSSKEGEPQ
jgi:S-DNA-T family DNA segregation ATPase FtsK/SpoIIIE